MKVPFLDLKAQIRSIRDDIDASVKQVIDSAAFVNGPVLQKFESEFAAACDVPFGVGTSSGTTAIHLALLAMEIGPGDEVIVPVNTFIATAEAVIQSGAACVFADVDPDTALLDPDSVERSITPATKAIIAVHLFGQIAPMAALAKIARQHSLKLLEDAAQAHCATQNGRPAGSLGDCACFSFFPGKNLGAFGDAGMIITGAKDIADRSRMLRDHGRKDKYFHEIVGFNERMDPLQAAILSVKLSHLKQWNAARREKASVYNNMLSKSVTPIRVLDGNESIYHLYVIKTSVRDGLKKELQSREIDCGIHYPVPLHLQPALRFLNHKKGDFPNAEMLAETMISLPIFPELTQEQQQFVIDTVNTFTDRAN
jgi:dTDP-4-amino-4,6-dideoxygalactose transaminase